MSRLLQDLSTFVSTFVERHYSRYSRAALARPKTFALWLVLLCVPAVILDAQFFGRVRTGLQDLLPDGARSVKEIAEIHAHLGGQSNLTVIAQSDDPAQNRAFIAALGEKVKAAQVPGVRSVQWNVNPEREWLKDHGALLLPKDDFDDLSRTFDQEIKAEKQANNPLVFDADDLDDRSAASPSFKTHWDDLARRLRAEGETKDRFPNGFLEDDGGKLVVLLIWMNGSDLDLAPAEKLQNTVDATISSLHRQFPDVRVSYNGNVPTIIEEHEAVLADLSLSTVLVFFLVGALIVLYFRSLRAVLTVVFALLPGLACTFAIGRLTVGSLNSNSAFLGSIIAGNGINYPLLLLAYFRLSPQRLDLAHSYQLAAWEAFPGTLGAAATASAAYGGLAAAQFRGFSEFGWIGGLGMLTTWLLTFLAMPIAIGLFNPPRRAEGEASLAVFAARFYESLRAPRIGAAIFMTVALVLTAVGIHAAATSGLYEMDINILRDRKSFATGAASWDARMNKLFGVWLNPVAALAAKPEDREAAAESLRQALTPGGLAERVETIESMVPARAEQERRLAVLRRARRLLANHTPEELPTDLKPYLDRWLAPQNLQPITQAQVPPTLVEEFRELDGRTDRTVLSFPSIAINYGDARNLRRFAEALRSVQLPAGTVVAGSFLFMAEIIDLVEDEAPKVIGFVCLLVALALLPIFARRLRRIPISVLTIAAVAFSAQSIMLALGVRVNMFNFAAVPITIGVGSDYLVNLFGAMDAFNTDARQAAGRMGGAILLCSLTTVVGYLSLVFARSGALRTFGWAAVLGEIMAVTTVLLVVPALSRPGAAMLPEGTQQAA